MAANGSARDVRRAAMDLLARREHSADELMNKLKKRFGPSSSLVEIAQATVSSLAQEGLQSDERYAQSVVRQCRLKGLGPRRINQSLREKGVHQTWEQVVDPADADIDWFSDAERVFTKKFGATQLPEAAIDRRKEQARRARFMQYRGFEPDHYSHLLNDDFLQVS